MTITPNTAELYSSHIPALATLVSLGWDYLSPEDCLAARGGNSQVVLRDVLVEQLRRRTFDYKGRTYPLSTNAIAQIVRELTSPALNEGLITANEKLYNAITLGITVTEFVDGKKHSVTVPIIDWAHPLANSFVASEEMEVLAVPGTHTRRPDIVGFVNGIPLLVIEAKRPDSGNPNKSMVDEGISQTIRNQGQEEIPHLFAYAHLLLSIGMTDGRYGTTRTPRKFWAQWREEEFGEDHFVRIKNEALATEPRAQFEKHVPTASCAGLLNYLNTHYSGQYGNDVYNGLTDRLFGDGNERKHQINRILNFVIPSVEIEEFSEFSEPRLRYRASMPVDVETFVKAIKTFIKKAVIFSPSVQHLEFKGQMMVIAVFEVMKSEPKSFLPPDIFANYEKSSDPLREICDYVAGMTDTYLLKTYERLFSPRMGSVFDKL